MFTVCLENVPPSVWAEIAMGLNWYQSLNGRFQCIKHQHPRLQKQLSSIYLLKKNHDLLYSPSSAFKKCCILPCFVFRVLFGNDSKWTAFIGRWRSLSHAPISNSFRNTPPPAATLLCVKKKPGPN